MGFTKKRGLREQFPVDCERNEKNWLTAPLKWVFRPPLEWEELKAAVAVLK